MSEYENDPYNIRAVDATGSDTTTYDPYTVISSEQRKKQREKQELDNTEEMSNWESFKNSLYNAFEMIDDVDEFYGVGTGDKSVAEVAEEGNLGAYSGMSIARTIIYENIFGRENVKEMAIKYPSLFKTFLSSDSETFKKVLENFEIEKQQQKKTKTFAEADSFTDYLTVVGGSVVNVLGSVGYNLGTLGTGFFVEFAADNFITANEAKAKSKGKSIDQLLKDGEADVDAPVRIAALQAGLEYVGFSKIMKPFKVSKTINKKVGKFLTKSYKNNKNLRIGLDIISTGKTEALTEMGQTGLEIYNKELSEAKAKNEDINAFESVLKGMFSPEGVESGLQGFFGGGGLKGAGYSAKTLSNVRKTEKDIDVEADLNKFVDLTKRYNLAKDEDVKSSIKEQLDGLEKTIKGKIKKGNDIYNSLSSKNIKDIENLSDLADVAAFRANKLIEKFKEGKISKEDFSVAIEGLSNQYKKNKQSIKEIILNRNIEFAKKEGKKIGKNVDVVDNTQNFQKIYEEIVPENQIKKDDDGNIINIEDRDGFIFGDQIYINKTVAREKGAISVGSHELLHGIIGNSFTSLDTKDKIKLGKSFISVLNAEQEAAVRKRLKESYGLEGDAIFQSEEMFTAFSDAIAKKEISFNENVFSQLKNAIQEILRKFGINKEFENGRQVYNFLKEYQSNVKEGKLGERVTSFAKKQDKSTVKKDSRSSLIEDINKLQQGATTKAEFQQSNIFNNVFKAIQSGGAINNYIRSLQMSPEKTRETIDSVIDRLINFDPAAKRKDGSVIGPEGLGEFVMANVGFGKLDAAKSLAVKAEKTKKEVKIDSKEAKELEDKPTTKTQTKQGPKARVLKSLADININNREVISSTARAEINALIEQNPKNLEEKISKIIDKEITKAVKAQMGKISNVKGEVVVSEEYKAFIALNYENIVKSLDVTTIKNNYKTLFELTEIGKEDRKTKKSDKPSLKKDSNYRKGIFKIETNKAKFTKFFTEGGYTTLLARQKGLANQIAKGIVENVVNNEIINNSNNIDAVLKAEIQNLSNQLNKQKNEVVGNYADQIKFSNTQGQKALQQAGNLVNLTGNNAITDVWNLETQQPIKGKYIPEVVQIVWNQVLKGNIYSDKSKALVDIIRKIPKNIIKGNLGTALETFKINVGVQAAKKYEGLTMLGEWVQEGGIPDFFADIFGNALYAEAKFATSRGGKVSTNFTNWKTGKFKINKRLEGNIEFVEKSVKKALKNSKQLVKDLKDLGFDLADQDTVVDLETHAELGAKKAVVSDTSVVVGADYIGRIYANKEYPVYLIDIDGAGLYYMPGDPFIEALAKELGIPKLEGNFPLITRILPQSVKENGEKIGYKYKLTTEPLIDPKNLKVKSDFSLSDIKTFDAIMNSKAVANLKKEQEAKNKTKFSKSVNFSRTINDPKGITVLDFDDTLATTKSLVKFTTPEGTTGTLNAEEYANSYEGLLDKGYVFDFSDFNKVVKGKLAPLFNKAIKLQSKFGPENMFVLTARPPQAQKAIFDFLKANGLNIPLKNITGLGNSTAEAKALWVADKVGEGFNDFYFADDALQNVQAVKNMLDQFDVKSKVQQAKVKFSNTLSDKFNDQLENVTGIKSFKRFERTKARKRGAEKGKFRLFIPPSHEDFVGLLYNFMGKGKEGDAHRDFLEQALIRPLNRAYKEVDTAKQAVANDYKALNKQMPEVNKMLSKKTPDGDFTYQDAIRVYLWDKHGYKIPGLSPIDQKNLVDLVKSDGSLQSYAETLNVISKQEAYVDPGPNWETGNIRIDLVDATGRVGRASYFAEFQENADIMFSEENLNKIEAAYGTAFREALEDMLHRIKTGVNRPKGSSAKPNIFMNWLNASVAGVMFLNVRSSLLQQMSNVNYLNFADNNILAAGLAFANQPQYWKDFAMIFNSDMLKQRRGGLQTDINGAELAEAIKKARPGNLFDQVAIIVGKALRLGFLPTQIGDNIAIATGGAAFYRNRVNKYIKDGLSKKEAEAKAFTDFQNITQSTQQSARPDMTSQQQSSWIGKLILNFLNTPSQYNRIIKKAGSDILNRRITPPNTSLMQSNMSNASRILYYGAAQNLIFYSLQTALFAVMFGDEDEDEEKRAEQYLKKKERVINGSIDTILRGSGIYGVAVSTLKNMAIKFMEQREKGYNPDESAVIMEMLNFSPVVGIKARRIVNAEKTLNYNKKVIEEMETLDIDNPLWSAVTNYTQTITTAPVNKIYQKIINLRNAADNDYTALQRILFFSGYTTWSLNLGDTKKMKEIKEKVKSKNKKPKKARKSTIKLSL